ncbi:MAG: hypothetical protein H6953_11590 [Chromatiaceae bacterium]|nr:hypothetical protein [Gammaproteobacteria bacterium]MCP5306074.1 hypothetical protein [Chromatiaceae bacterium]MCP5316010.1 hypothetical protein [Chromatiaceae bacterium]
MKLALAEGDLGADLKPSQWKGEGALWAKGVTSAAQLNMTCVIASDNGLRHGTQNANRRRSKR